MNRNKLISYTNGRTLQVLGITELAEFNYLPPSNKLVSLQDVSTSMKFLNALVPAFDLAEIIAFFPKEPWLVREELVKAGNDLQHVGLITEAGQWLLGRDGTEVMFRIEENMATAYAQLLQLCLVRKYLTTEFCNTEYQKTLHYAG